MPTDAELRALAARLRSASRRYGDYSTAFAYLVDKVADELESLIRPQEPEQAARERPEIEIRTEAAQLLCAATYSSVVSAYLEGYRAAERNRT